MWVVRELIVDIELHDIAGQIDFDQQKIDSQSSWFITNELVKNNLMKSRNFDCTLNEHHVGVEASYFHKIVWNLVIDLGAHNCKKTPLVTDRLRNWWIINLEPNLIHIYYLIKSCWPFYLLQFPIVLCLLFALKQLNQFPRYLNGVLNNKF